MFRDSDYTPDEWCNAQDERGQHRADQRLDAERDEPDAPPRRARRVRRMTRDFTGPYSRPR